MSANRAFESLGFSCGQALANRFMLAPLTNQQSGQDGVMSDDEFLWLTKRAEGGFGGTMTCASHVQAIGKGFSGQLGCFSAEHLEGLTRLATGIRAHGSTSLVQIHHAGMRSPEELIGELPVCPSANAETGARALTGIEVAAVIEDFIAAGVRCEAAGFDGVEIHGAHGYLLAQFFSSEINQRTDNYGGSFENRVRILFEIITGIRKRCSAKFIVGVRISPERFGIDLGEARELARLVMADQRVDFLDVSLWDAFKEPEDEAYRGRTLLSYFTDLERSREGTDVPCRLGVAGKIYGSKDVAACLDEGVDFVSPGRAAILHHNFPRRVQDSVDFEMVQIPVTRDYLRNEGLGETFVEYMAAWKGFVE